MYKRQIEDIKEIQEWIEGIQVAIQAGGKDIDFSSSGLDQINPQYLIGTPSRIDGIEIEGVKKIIEIGPEFLENPELSKKMVNQGTEFILILDGQEFDIRKPDIYSGLNSLSPSRVFIEMPNIEGKLEELDLYPPNVGFVLSGGIEQKPGFKDFYELAPVLEYLDQD